MTTTMVLEFGDWENVNSRAVLLRIRSSNLSLVILVPDFSISLACWSLTVGVLSLAALGPLLEVQHQYRSWRVRSVLSGLLWCSLMKRFRQYRATSERLCPN